MKHVVIAGSGPAGLSAGIAVQCSGHTATLIAPMFGGRMWTSPRLENVPGFPLGVTGAAFADRLIAQALRLGVSFVEDRVLGLSDWDRGQFRVKTEKRHTAEMADAFIIATGMTLTEGRWHRPALVRSGDCVVVAGGGNAAVQTALGRSTQGCRTILVVRGNDLSGCDAYLRNRLPHSNVEVRMNTQIQECDGRKVILSGPDGSEVLEAAAVEMLIGARPNLSWTGVDLDDQGFAKIDSIGRTSRKGVWCAGDACAGSIPSVPGAAGMGMTVGFHVTRSLNDESYSPAALTECRLVG